MDSDYYLSVLHEQISFWDSLFDPIVFFILLFLLLFFSVLMSISEVAYFSLSPDDMNEILGEKRVLDPLVKRLISRSEYLLASIFITEQILNVTLVLFSAFAFYSLVNFSFAPFVGFLLLVLILSFLMVLTKVIPKRYARIYPLKMVRLLAPWMNFINFLCYPFSKLLVRSTSFVQKRLKKRTPDKAADELSNAFNRIPSRVSDDKEMIAEVIRFYNKTADEIMTSRLDVEDIDIHTGFRSVVSFVLDSGYSRIPVYEESEDNMKGILYLRDLLPYLDKPDDYEWQQLIRPAYFVPETKKIDDLLEEFRTNKIHMAVVVDEFGGTSGIVTMEDILEEIVGEIFDEYDEDDKLCIRMADGSFIVKAKILLTNFFRMTDIDPSEFGELTEEVETLGGLLLEIKGGFPQVKELIEYKKYHFRILEIDNRRILKVKFSQIKEGESSN
ncbi:MAG: gliding motility-associated protein GldE [Massilibacteroides sp.]|nr:gliding motility-associated protein GldE [Massilibacteroides sp.]MDD3062207.1 gliding motility-associated protein GldE [Massilibacteroides sp.]